MTIAAFDHLDPETKKQLLNNCCGSDDWVTNMMMLMPFEDLVDVLEDAEQVWYSCDEQAWLQAFSRHPKIGDMDSLKEKYASTAHLASGEQASVLTASDETLEELSKLNSAYAMRFGFIFIVCATGRSAGEILQMLNERINNDRQTELEIAAGEQNNITKLRLQTLFT